MTTRPDAQPRELRTALPAAAETCAAWYFGFGFTWPDRGPGSLRV